MRKILVPILTIVLAAVILLGLYNGLNEERFVYEMHDLQEKMEAMLPGSKVFTPEEYTGEDSNIHRVWKADTGYIVETITYGYAGNIRMLIGVHNDGNVTGLQIRDMEETYGLGAEALKDWEFLAQFLNKGGNFTVATHGADASSSATGDTTAAAGEEIEVDALTGATVTSKAIARSVNSAVGFVTGADASSAATSWGG